MATKKNQPGGRGRTTPTNAPNANTGSQRAGKNDEFNLPAEPEVTRRTAASTPGREPAARDVAGGPAARASRERAYRENAMRNQRQSHQSTTRSTRTGTVGLMSLIGGAGIGAALMYLLDPEAGEHRRAEWGERAKTAAGTTRNVVGNVAETSGNVLGNLWDMASETAGSLAHRAADAGSAGAAAASSFGSSLAERASDTTHSLRKGARRQYRSARDTASGWLGREEEHSYLPSTATTVSAAAALAAGVGLMYLLDPTDGARRRALLGQKMTRCINETGDFFRRTGKHLANRSRGVAHETRSMFQHGADVPTDRQLAERIRSRIGHLQQQNAMVNVVAMDGRVTITGQCSPDDVSSLLSTIQSTPGVASIVNLLDVRSAGAATT